MMNFTEPVILVKTCEYECKRQLTNYHFNTNFIPMFIVFFFFTAYQILNLNREWFRGKYIENGMNPDYVDNMIFVSLNMCQYVPLIYFIWYYLHFSLGIL